jgi:hypothetical protein
MNATWRKTIAKTVFWLVTELVLNVTGLDNLADYSEFIFEYLPETTAFYAAEVQTPSQYPLTPVLLLNC